MVIARPMPLAAPVTIPVLLAEAMLAPAAVALSGKASLVPRRLSRVFRAAIITTTVEREDRAMDVGFMMLFASYGWDNCPDDQVWDEEIRLARLAADLGFDVLWSAEHHFNYYSFVPDNLHLLSYLDGLCPSMIFCRAALILPWYFTLLIVVHV